MNSRISKNDYQKLSYTQRMLLDNYRSTLRSTKESMMNPINAWAMPRRHYDVCAAVATNTMQLTEKRINSFRREYEKVVKDFGTVAAEMNDTFINYAQACMEEDGYTSYTSIDGILDRLMDIEWQSIKRNNLQSVVSKNKRDKQYQNLRKAWRNHYLAALPKTIRDMINSIFI